MTLLEKIQQIEFVIEEEIRPVLQRDGGDVELVDVQGHKVIIRLVGACGDCLSSTVTQRGLVEEKLQQLVDPSIEVVEEER